jgi:hypothetical protein
MSAPTINSRDPSADVSQDRPQRLFFALWPDEAVRQRLLLRARQADSLALRQGRVVPYANFHLTLAYLTLASLASPPSVDGGEVFDFFAASMRHHVDAAALREPLAIPW